MSKMKMKFEKVLEVFMENHPDFRETEAADYILHHYDAETIDTLEKQMKMKVEPRLELRTRTMEEAKEVARLLGWRLHYCSDYLMSKIVIRREGNTIKVIVFDEDRKLDLLDLLILKGAN